MPILTETPHAGGFLVWEALRDYCRSTVILASGDLQPSSIPGKITASGKYAAHDLAASNGTQTAIIAKGFSHQFWQAVKAGAEEAATRNGVTITFEAPNTEAEIDKQTDMLNTAISKAPQGLGFAVLDSQAQVPALQKAADAGIPIVAFDSGVYGDLPLTTCTTDNMAAAAAADGMAKAIGEKDKVAAVRAVVALSGSHRVCEQIRRHCVTPAKANTVFNTAN
jgi:ABC-type sugar transport system substrate-binding protein